MPRKIRILDLDNCIADDGWRIPRIQWQHKDLDRRYHEYHQLAAFDLLGNGRLLATPHDIAVFTARPVAYRAMTEEWLKRNCIRPKVLMMRNNGEHKPSVILKAQHLDWLINFNGYRLEDILDAYDDRPDVVEMYRTAGINAHVAAIHDVCAMTPPAGLNVAGPPLVSLGSGSHA
jgi:hypothetical protein